MRLNILFLYNATQTFTNTVYEHLSAFARYSRHAAFFLHQNEVTEFAVDLARFDAICIHYCVRLAFDQLSPAAAEAIGRFSGLKFLFIQDEYENTARASQWIRTLDIQLVFTVVPERSIERVYPKKNFCGTRFVTNLTGYVPLALAGQVDVPPPSQRSLMVGYRGRPLSIRYGQLGVEKILIGKMVKEYCERQGIANDIAWNEEARIYGQDWYDFLGSCRATLGSESGSNVFDWDGTLTENVVGFRTQHPEASDEEVYRQCVYPHEVDGLMNQVSPRLFEAIAAKSVLVLFEGSYSGVVLPGEHYISLQKDGSNLDEVFAKLHDGVFVDRMAARAFDDVIGSGKYSYETFVGMVDTEVEAMVCQLAARQPLVGSKGTADRRETKALSEVTTSPVRATLLRQPVLPAGGEPEDSACNTEDSASQWDGTFKLVVPVARIWSRLPRWVRAVLRPVARHAIGWRGGASK